MDKDTRPFKIDRPEGLADYIKFYCQKQTYLVFSWKAWRCACTRCGAEFPINHPDLLGIKHSRDCRLTLRCPECGADAVPKETRYGRKKLTDYGRIIWTKADGRDTYIEVDEFVIDYTTIHPAVLLNPASQIRINAEEQVRMDHDHWYDRWIPIKEIKLCARPNQYGWSKFHDHMYWTEESIESPEGAWIEAGTDLQYANLSAARWMTELFDDHEHICKMIRYMSDFAKYPAVEILEKSGFDKIVMDRAGGRLSRNLNMRQKDLRKILKVNGADVRKLREVNPSISFLEDLKYVRREAPWADIGDVKDLDRILGGRYMQPERLEQIRMYTDMSKLLRKLLDEVRATGDTIFISDYSDYLSAVLRLGWRLDKKTLYPANFLEAHDMAIKEVAKLKDETCQESFSRFQQEITGMDEPFTSDGYLIRPAETPGELIVESKILNHCVRTYVDRICKGLSAILFIRKTEDPDTPYFTLELSPGGRIVQCRGMRNCAYPPEIAAFIAEWQIWRKQNAKKAVAA